MSVDELIIMFAYCVYFDFIVAINTIQLLCLNFVTVELILSTALIETYVFSFCKVTWMIKIILTEFNMSNILVYSFIIILNMSTIVSYML